MKQRVSKMMKYGLSFLFFYRLVHYVRAVASRPVFYDVFVSKKRNSLCVIAPYYSTGGFADAVCWYESGETKVAIKGVIVDDVQKSCLIVTFALPDGFSGGFRYSIRKGAEGREICSGSHDAISVPSKRFKLSIATLFKYEVDFLKEWLDYHIGLGVEHFYLYENNAKPDPRIRAIVEPYIAKSLVTLIPWPHPYVFYNYKLRSLWPYDSHLYSQMPQINHAIYKYTDETEWLMCSDVDEYFYSPSHTPIKDIIGSVTADTVSVSAKGLWFGGTEDEARRAKADGVLKTFLLSEKSPSSSPKCIFRTENVRFGSVHNVVSGDGKEVEISEETLRFNHYRGLGWQKRFDPKFARDVRNTEILGGN